MRLIIPGVIPSVNHQYRNAVVRGRRMRVLSNVAKDFAEDIVYHAIVWKAREKWTTAPGQVIARLWYYWPDKRRRDTHNTFKLLFDCLEDAGIYKDDKDVLPQVMAIDVDRERPRVEIEFILKEKSA